MVQGMNRPKSLMKKWELNFGCGSLIAYISLMALDQKVQVCTVLCFSETATTLQNFCTI